MKIGRLSIKLARSKTCWWVNPNNNPLRFREDKIVSFIRLYSRALRCYFYVLTIGRLKIMFWPKLNKGN